MVSPYDWFKTYNHLGSFYPYYNSGHGFELYTSISNAIENIPSNKRLIDPVAVVEILIKSYILGDRTIVQSISHTPWMAKPNFKGGWEYAMLPLHGYRQMPVNEIAKELKLRLQNEIISYLQVNSRVGILLSGGMDSRILAGVIRELQLKGDWNGQVTAFTWGINNCRDVKYARKIASMFSWDWIHLKLDSEILYNNFFIAAEMGAEFAPFHLHAIPQVVNFKDLDVVLAASYGDSVGRAEYSGTHLLNLKPILRKSLFSWINKKDFGIIRNYIFNEIKREMIHDAYGYMQYLGLKGERYIFCEIEQEMHYMRRKLQAPMSYIGMSFPFYQLFTAPETFGFMWSLDPKIRNNSVYIELIKLLPGDLVSIPWTRTGKLFDVKTGNADPVPKEHHQYGLWLRQELHDFIKTRVLSDTILSLGIFNEKSLKKLIKLWPRSRTVSTNAIDEIFGWLATLAIFIEKYKIKNPYNNPEENVLVDFIHSIYGSLVAWFYQETRERIRK